MRYYIVLYLSRHHHEKEKPPSWLQLYQEGIHTCKDKSVVVIFIEAEKLPTKEEEQQEIVDRLISAGGGKLSLIHYFEVVFGRNVRFGTNDIIKISYSSADPYYGALWNDINNSRNCEELVERLEYWVRHYTIDPIRRIKHQAMNLFAPLDTDCQYLLELWKQRRYDEARRHLENIQKDWQGEPPYSNAPLSKLARLWYLLVGDIKKTHEMNTAYPMMAWPHFVQLGYVSQRSFANALCVHSPAKIVSLPSSKCLYEWLYKVGKPSSSAWENTLATAGLKRPDKQYEPNTQEGIYRFAVELQKRLIEGNLPDLRPDTCMQSFKGGTVQENFEEFRHWIRCLNNAFETLVEEVGGRVSLKVGE